MESGNPESHENLLSFLRHPSCLQQGAGRRSFWSLAWGTTGPTGRTSGELPILRVGGCDSSPDSARVGYYSCSEFRQVRSIELHRRNGHAAVAAVRARMHCCSHQ
jgi:hypothetical protein